MKFLYCYQVQDILHFDEKNSEYIVIKQEDRVEGPTSSGRFDENFKHCYCLLQMYIPKSTCQSLPTLFHISKIVKYWQSRPNLHLCWWPKGVAINNIHYIFFYETVPLKIYYFNKLYLKIEDPSWVLFVELLLLLIRMRYQNMNGIMLSEIV